MTLSIGTLAETELNANFLMKQDKEQDMMSMAARKR
eukprot:CAMPEP_0185574114 /NCGR_PEP_ID=MMETSP0434-20130131/5667_1 /TAXON_ID=626734 ORGANISM="Favella taraikaensis, Strain Fe Narragansett Bay" /NCGR_SAMPLE_ID=MMETSP0434 /ASSEMBLY_ACC=CAM_ASM_000379 /LENGTH=35 /DNA_ID= /DNA_START= /DNA_END= /DNA_ORIENTATION=